MLTRRAFAAAPLGLAACAAQGAGLGSAAADNVASPDETLAFVRRAIGVAGGENALRNARVLAWTGQAIIRTDPAPMGAPSRGQLIEIGVDTIVEPFVYARSETWLSSQGRSSARVLEINENGGWAIRSGQRSALPQTQVVHERQQFALYGLMRLVTLLHHDVRLILHEPWVCGGPPWRQHGMPVLHCRDLTRLTVEHPSAPRTDMFFDVATERLVGASNIVSNSEDNGPQLHQSIRFDGEIEAGGVRWPRRLNIVQNDEADWSRGAGTIEPFFELTLDTFTPRPTR